MEPKRIYLIRHGETEFNKRGLVQGSGIDSNLNQTGYGQALAFYNHYKHIRFDKVYISSLKRTYQSVQHFINAGIPWQSMEGLNELSWGSKEGKTLTKEDNIQYYYTLKAWSEGMLHVKPEGGESPEEVAERQMRAMQHIMSHRAEQNVLVCMHGRAMRILLCQLTGISMSQMDRFEHSNLCLYVLKHQADMQFSIELANCTRHLTSEPSVCAHSVGAEV